MSMTYSLFRDLRRSLTIPSHYSTPKLSPTCFPDRILESHVAKYPILEPTRVPLLTQALSHDATLVRPEYNQNSRCHPPRVRITHSSGDFRISCGTSGRNSCIGAEVLELVVSLQRENFPGRNDQDPSTPPSGILRVNPDMRKFPHFRVSAAIKSIIIFFSQKAD